MRYVVVAVVLTLAALSVVAFLPVRQPKELERESMAIIRSRAIPMVKHAALPPLPDVSGPTFGAPPLGMPEGFAVPGSPEFNSKMGLFPSDSPSTGVPPFATGPMMDLPEQPSSPRVGLILPEPALDRTGPLVPIPGISGPEGTASPMPTPMVMPPAPMPSGPQSR